MAVLALVGCQMKEQDVQPQEPKHFTATIEEGFDGGDTRTYIDEHGNVRWTQGDQVSIFAGSTANGHYQVTDASAGKTSADFDPVTGGGFVGGGEIANNVAFYPYASTAEVSKNGSSYVISDVTLPSTQNYAAGSFGNGAFPMAAVTSNTEDMHLKFKNVLGGLKLQLTGTASVASISVTGNQNEILCGVASVTVSNGSTPSISLTDASAKTVTLDCGAGVQLNAETATPFVIALPPMKMEGGFTVVVTDTEGKQMEIKTTKTQTITRSNLLKMPAVEYEGTVSEIVPEGAVDLGLSVMWATCNLCETGFVSSPEEYGDYYAWGELEPRYAQGHSQDSPCSDWRTINEETITGYYFYDNRPLAKYNFNSEFGTVDDKTDLGDYDYVDDAAKQTLGGNWRIPTEAEWQELLENCTWTWTTQNGVNGHLAVADNGNSVFFPAAGGRTDRILNSAGSSAYYWSSSLYTFDSHRSWHMLFSSSRSELSNTSRNIGCSVRPVADKGVRIPVESVSLNQNALNLVPGESVILSALITPSNATKRSVRWTSSNSSVATVLVTGKVIAIAPGTTTITATTFDGGLSATCSVTVDAFIPEPVDLGLPSGMKWAPFNIGAASPENHGLYFQWGDTEGYASEFNVEEDGRGYIVSTSDGKIFDWSDHHLNPDYLFCAFDDSSTEANLIKYVSLGESDRYGYHGFYDDKDCLDPEDDAAIANWGGQLAHANSSGLAGIKRTLHMDLYDDKWPRWIQGSVR